MHSLAIDSICERNCLSCSQIIGTVLMLGLMKVIRFSIQFSKVLVEDPMWQKIILSGFVLVVKKSYTKIINVLLLFFRNYNLPAKRPYQTIWMLLERSSR